MTCVVAIEHKGNIWMGADSAAVDEGGHIQVRADHKVWVNSPFVFGFAGSFRLGQLLHWKLALPVQGDAQTTEEFMCSTFIDSVRGCLEDGGYSAEAGSDFLVGYNRRLFCVESDFQVAEALHPHMAIGSGSPYALGALRGKAGTPRQRLLHALTAAEAFSAGVRAPFHIVKLTDR